MRSLLRIIVFLLTTIGDIVIALISFPLFLLIRTYKKIAPPVLSLQFSTKKKLAALMRKRKKRRKQSGLVYEHPLVRLHEYITVGTTLIKAIVLGILDATITILALLRKVLFTIYQATQRIITFRIPLLFYKIRHGLFFHIRLPFRDKRKSQSLTVIKSIKAERPGGKPPILYFAPFRLRHKNVSLFGAFFTGIIITIFLLFIPYILYQWFQTLPTPYLLTRRDQDVTTKIFDRKGTLLYEIYAEQNRTPIPLKEIPDVVKYATIAIEDQDFYKHPGFSFSGIVRAARETLMNKNLQGGSTITQQLIKSTLLTPEIKLSRKIKEVILAFWAERIYSKDQILEMYLNQVPYGGTAWGIEAAAQTYFGKSVRDVTLAEAALLAGLPAAPSLYSPFVNNSQKAYDRQKEVIRRMIEDGYISPEQAKEALSQDVAFRTPTIPIRAPHFVLYVKELLEQKYGSRLIERGGLRIMTTLDSDIQEKAQDIVRAHVDALEKLRVGNGAAVITDPETGEILAMVGSKDYFNEEDDGNVNITTSMQQPGSSIKVVTYTAALENGFTAASIIQDSPIVYQIPGSTAYAPVNYDGRFHGAVPVRYALGNSYNIPAVKVLSQIGLSTMLEKARAMGISSWNDSSRFGLSLTLGSGEVTMLEMASVYGTLANNGKRVTPTPILEVSDYAGRILERLKPNRGAQAVKPEAAWIISNILSDNVARTSAFGPNSGLVIPGKTVSVKTGTSNDKRDNWAIGYTPSYVVTVWVGNNDNSPMDQNLASGITGATPIWHDIMAELLKEKPDEIPTKPDGVVALPCYHGRVEYFIKGTEPPGRCVGYPTPSSSPTPEQLIQNEDRRLTDTPDKQIEDISLQKQKDKKKPRR